MREPGATRVPPRQMALGALYVFAMGALAAVAAWPIYRSGAFIAVVVVAVLVGAAVAVVGTHLRWRAGASAGAVALAIVVVGMFLAVPSPGADLLAWPAAAADVLKGAVFGWKDLITVELPVGSYRNLLVPALIVFVSGTAGALHLVWLERRLSTGAVGITLAMVAFGIAFGRGSTSAPWVLGDTTFAAPVETLIGAAGVIVALAWLAGRARAQRYDALRRAARDTGLRVSRRRQGSDVRRTALAAAMATVAVVVGAWAGPALASGQPREVLRSGTDPALTITQATSPLSQYRALVTAESQNDVLFQVTPSSPGQPLPDRVRLATLTAYDGETYRALADTQDPGTASFVRVPSTRDAGAGATLTLRVDINRLRGIWMPTAGRVQNVTFLGPDASALADSFYYNAEAQGAVQIRADGLQQGDAYTLTVVDSPAPELASIRASSSSAGDVTVPENLVTWLEQQGVTPDGAGLAEAVSRLRERGYLSHALSVNENDPPRWMRELEGYVFRPSAAGHSLARIDAMFGQLLERSSAVNGTAANDTAPNDSAAGASLVAAVGDDEQFAVATALIAQQMGFSARVVVGVRLADSGSDLAACDDGQCRATDLSAWTEVQASTGQWVSIDVTPQHELPFDNEVGSQRDPEVVTEVRPDTAEEVVAPDPVRPQADIDDGDVPQPEDLSALWAAVRVVGVGALALAIVLGPFIAIMVAKALRRRSRRQHEDPSARILGGWDEFVDTAVDHGRPSPGTQTRSELAELYQTPRAATLAMDTDRALFSGAAAGAESADAFWSIVDDERHALVGTAPWWRRARAAVSLKSFTRSLAGVRRSRPSASARSERLPARGERSPARRRKSPTGSERKGAS